MANAVGQAEGMSMRNKMIVCSLLSMFAGVGLSEGPKYYSFSIGEKVKCYIDDVEIGDVIYDGTAIPDSCKKKCENKIKVLANFNPSYLCKITLKKEDPFLEIAKERL